MQRMDPGPVLILAAWAGIVGAIGIFLWSGLAGPHGLARLAEAETAEAGLEARLAALRERRAAAENRVRRLGPEHLDLDLLDERARAVLGLARPDEMVIAPLSRRGG